MVFVIPLIEATSYSAQSTITEAEAYACMGYDKSRKQTEEEALTNAKRKAVEFVSTYIKSETRVKDFQLEKDLIEAYANATVKVIQEMEKSWYRDPSSGDCFKLKIKAEVLPDEKAMTKIAREKGSADDPSAPLNVQVWTDKKEYGKGEKIKIYVKGNKPFYARVAYKDAQGKILQLLPNLFRKDNYFNGGVVYELPSGTDRFELEVTPPFGEEEIIVYAGTNPLGEIDLKASGSIYEVKTKQQDIGIKTRAVKIRPKEGAPGSGASEFFEGKATLKTR
ncbi:MAG: DUF4384 domain-containing protein [Deltaproteobacteria bacterium]|nr:DUF4384 domain-containing protein [Deltaproteobacteria bacterium]